MLEEEGGCAVATRRRVFRFTSHESGCLECSRIRIMVANPGRLRVLLRARVELTYRSTTTSPSWIPPWKPRLWTALFAFRPALGWKKYRQSFFLNSYFALNLSRNRFNFCFQINERFL